MAGPQNAKVLRIGIFQGDRCIEERLIRKRQPVTVGQTLSNTFVISSSAMPESLTLFALDPAGHYSLEVTDRMGGRLSLGNEVVDLTRLRHVSSARRTENGYALKLDDKARGKITIGETRILFQFVAPPAASTGLLPSALGGGAVAGLAGFLNGPVLIALFLSALIQLGPLGYIIARDWPEPEEYDVLLPDWFLEEEVEYIPEDEEEKEDELEPEEEIEGLDALAEIPSDEPALVPEPDKRTADNNDGPKNDAPKTAEKSFADKQEGKKMAAQLLGVDGGENIGAGIVAGITGDSVADIGLGSLDAGSFGRDGNGQGAGLGLGTAGGSASGEPGLKGGGGGGGGNRAVGTGPAATDAGKERDKISFKISDDTKIPDSVGKADKKSMESVFRSKKSQVEKCYKRVIQKHGAQPGKVVVQIAIGGDGGVIKVKVTADEVKHGLADCITAKIKRWKFPATGGTVSVFKRWVFS